MSPLQSLRVIDKDSCSGGTLASHVGRETSHTAKRLFQCLTLGEIQDSGEICQVDPHGPNNALHRVDGVSNAHSLRFLTALSLSVALSTNAV